MAAEQQDTVLFEYEEELLNKLIFETFGDQRYTQDSPIMPDVWIAFARTPLATIDLLLTPLAGDSPSKLAMRLTERLSSFHGSEDDEVRLRRLDDAEMLGELSSRSVKTGTGARARFNVAYSRSSVVAEVDFLQLACVIVPMTDWWLKLNDVAKSYDELANRLKPLAEKNGTLAHIIADAAAIVSRSNWDFFRFCALVGFIDQARSAARDVEQANARARGRTLAQKRDELEDMMKDLINRRTFISDLDPIIAGYGEIAKQMLPYRDSTAGAERLPAIFMVTENRDAQLSISESRSTVKADAANNVFKIDTSDFAWAIIDSGIDARHPAFLDRKATDKFIADAKTAKTAQPEGTRGSADRVVADDQDSNRQESDSGNPPLDPEELRQQDIPIKLMQKLCRVRETYDFTFLRRMLAIKDLPPPDEGGPPADLAARIREVHQSELNHLRIRTVNAREIDWDIVAPLIRIPHDDNYQKPTVGHGTHVAGIIGADWAAKDNPESIELVGICPQIRLYDLRVFNPKVGGSDEFTVQYALQFVEHLNRNRDLPLIHGVNLSLSMIHKVMSFACGRTPVCDECNDLVSTGIVVVVAAGNDGYKTFKTDRGNYAGYHAASITDPGNAEDVITVGATHRSHPHNYGVSYFSSRGPTGDGRRKPDLVAPGEKITAPVLNCRVQRMDGTSMAAPHVSGAAALLMARHRELIGNPRRIKDILCRTATDLGRERHFQGAGMVDILRALQSV